ncbi:MAG: TraI domain-containing protein [Shewanella xiamenensis]|uniref:Relaxase n=1 Tax=Shewanella putrefaciens (strain 200) TaxID=399804 RepID=E6XSD6_SHEP2|nr:MULTISPECIES: MobH family relaxase [Shewanella]MCD8552109.1 TraI domain-containing protein [Shewanella xiamenensis]MCD8560398.1 TraI domain-containing protein [Shewanella xiamenensis]MCK7657649.1 TraI domain-containing protein [Shewanella sp. JNE4-2]MCT8858162.1 TraI domain-containing protein [Shewanella xiamenensis]MDH0451100.1 TraI domain-containing protein [Shewanella sp. GD04112]
MLGFLKNTKLEAAKQPPIVKANPKKANDGWYTAVAPSEWEKINEHVINTIYRGVRLEPHHTQTYYTAAISKLARYIQAFPASEYNHHSSAGGLLEHTLEVAKNTVMYRREVLYSENGKETEIEEQADVFAYACFTASLMHDIGKIITDIEVVYRKSESDKPRMWNPLYEAIPIGAQYKFRYNPHRISGVHELAGQMLTTALIPMEGIIWIKSYPKLWLKWISCIAGDHAKGGEVSKVVKFADSASAANNFTGQSSLASKIEAGEKVANSGHGAAEILLKAMRQAIESGDLPLNRIGGAGWCHGDTVYMVSQRTVQACRHIARSTGFSALPENDVTLFALLCDAGIATRHPVTNDLVHTLEITANKADKQWKGELTFLSISKSVLDPQNVLNLTNDNEIKLNDLTQIKGKNAKANPGSELVPGTNTNESVDSKPALFESVDKSSGEVIKQPQPNVAEESNEPDFFSAFMSSTANLKKSDESETKFLATRPIKPAEPSFNHQNSATMASNEQSPPSSHVANSELIQQPEETTQTSALPRFQPTKVDKKSLDQALNPFGFGIGKTAGSVIQDTESVGQQFLTWLSDSIRARALPFNDFGSYCFMVRDGVFVSSPNIFDAYSESLGSQVNRNEIIEELRKRALLQTAFEGAMRKLTLSNESKTVLDGILIKHEAVHTQHEKRLNSSIATLL